MILLNVCCAPCSLPVLSDPAIVLFFYSPNIYPEQEYKKRLEETRKVATIYNLKLYEGEYDHEQWLEFVRTNLPQSPEKYLENGERCLVCFRYRLEKTAVFARENGFSRFATALSVSRFKDIIFINNYAKLLAERNGLEYVTFPLDAEKAHQMSLELSKKYKIYRQKYCGCEFNFSSKA